MRFPKNLPKKKGGGRKKKETVLPLEVAQETTLPEQIVQQEGLVVAQEEPAKKKGGGHKKKDVGTENAEKKKRGPKKKDAIQDLTTEPKDEVVIPLQEQLQLLQLNTGEGLSMPATRATEDFQNENELELTEETFDSDNDSVDLIEHFVNNVLYYVDADGNWFDNDLNAISKPI